MFFGNAVLVCVRCNSFSYLRNQFVLWNIVKSSGMLGSLQMFVSENSPLLRTLTGFIFANDGMAVVGNRSQARLNPTRSGCIFIMIDLLTPLPTFR